MACGKLDVLCKAGELPGEIVGGAAESAVDALADAVSEGVGKMLATLGTAWVRLGTPNVTTADGSSPSPAVELVQSQLWWYMAAAAVFAVIVAGARMAWEQRAEPGRELLRGLLTLVVVSGCGLAVISLALSASDEFARNVVDAGLSGDRFSKRVTAMVGFTSASGGVLGPLLVIVLGLVAIAVSVVQIMLMVARAGVLVVLAGALPLAASFTSTEAGRMWFRRFVTWTVAFILYKPAAAIIYAAAFKLIGTPLFANDGLLSVLVGLALMVLAVIALPALIRVLTPMASAVASGGGGGAMLAAAVPTGAMAVRDLGGAAHGSSSAGANGSNGTGGPGEPGGPSGARGAGASPSGGNGGGRPGGGSGGSGGGPEPTGTPPAQAVSEPTAAASGGTGTSGAAAGPWGAAAGSAAAAGQSGWEGARSAAEGAAGQGEDEEGPRGSR